VGRILEQTVDLVLGRQSEEQALWERLAAAFTILNCYCDQSAEKRRLYQALSTAASSAGVPAAWLEADYDRAPPQTVCAQRVSRR
jgi:hypothetical protein